MAKWNSGQSPIQAESVQTNFVKAAEDDTPATVYTESPQEVNFVALQNNLQNCLSIIDNEVMKNYVPALQNCSVVPVDDATISALEQIQFFRISELVYQEDEFSVHKLATIFNALSNKPCTLVLMIQSDGQTNNFYLGVRSRDSRFSGGTMRQLLEQSFLGLFPGSKTDDYYNEYMRENLDKLDIGAISSVTCIADYKQDKDSFENKNFIQGLEKFIYSMQGKSFTAICIANNLEHRDLVETRKESACRRIKFLRQASFRAQTGNPSNSCVEKFLFWGTAKLTLSQKQDQMWIIFFSELAMRSEFQKDGSSSGRFSVSSKAFSD